MPEPFPTMEQVERAGREQVARWRCFLSPPKTADQQEIMDRITDRFLNMGGLTPGLRKKIGFSETAEYSQPTVHTAIGIVRLNATRSAVEQSATRPRVSKDAIHQRAQFIKAS